MFVLAVLLVPIYLAAVWAATFRCHDPGRRRAYLAAAGISLGLAAVVATVGVPYTRDSTRLPAVLTALALLALGPAVLPRLSRGARLALVAVLVALFAAPVVRVESLTRRHGEELQAAYDAKRRREPTDQVLFSVLDYSPDEATVLRVEGPESTMGYLLHFRRAEGRWDVATMDPPVLWSDAGSAFIACPYPTSALLLLHGVSAVGC